MKNILAKTRAATIKVGGFINRNYDWLLLGALLAAIVCGDAVLAFGLILAIFYSKLSEIANGLKVPSMNITIETVEVANAGANVKKTAEEHF